MVTDTGASISNILVSGSNWNFGLGTSVTNTIWASTSSNALWNPVASSSKTGTVNIEVMLTGVATDTLLETSNGVATNTIWWGLSVPALTPGGTFAQTINIISSC